MPQITGVPSVVNAHLGWITESFATDGTLEWLLSSMNAHMHLIPGPLQILPVTILASVRGVHLVPLLVLLKLCFVAALLGANIARRIGLETAGVQLLNGEAAAGWGYLCY